jgi:Flp pilus assembly protein TadG
VSLPGEGGFVVKLDRSVGDFRLPLLEEQAQQPRRRRIRDERGQAMVEFALIFFPLMIVVGGIIYFGIGLNYWLDMNRIANQGARFAAVNNWPAQCPRSTLQGYTCNNAPSTCSATLANGSHATLQSVLRCSARNAPAVSVCYPGKTLTTVKAGDPVRVKLTAPYSFWFMSSLKITLTATATMRLEQAPTLITGASGPTC